MLQQFYESRDQDDVLSHFDEQLRHRYVVMCIIIGKVRITFIDTYIHCVAIMI